MSTEEKIWSFLKAHGITDAGAAGLMGNLFAESGLRPNNLQNSYEGHLGMADAEYTELVDNGGYTRFSMDGAGYGIAQWTYHTRKAALLEYAKTRKRSIADLDMQLEFLARELTESFPAVLRTLKSATSVRAASDVVLIQFENPKDKSEAVKVRRAGYGQQYYNKYVTGSQKLGKGDTGKMGYTNSPLVKYKRLSPNNSGARNHAIDRISIHCVVGQCSVETLGAIFAPTSKQASCNYGIGPDGRVGMYVEECNRSWCTSSAENDNRAVTIETASDIKHPYAVTDKAFAALLDLCTDICRRNGKKKLLWFGDKAKTLAYTPTPDEMVLTVHRWFANKSCPGDYLYNRHGQIAEEVTRRLTGGTAAQTVTVKPADAPAPVGTAVSYAVRVTVPDLRIRTGPGTNYNPAGIIKPGVYNIVSEAEGTGATKWGKLKSGSGWIALDYAEKI